MPHLRLFLCKYASAQKSAIPPMYNMGSDAGGGGGCGGGGGGEDDGDVGDVLDTLLVSA